LKYVPSPFIVKVSTMTLMSPATLTSRRTTHSEELNHRFLIQIRPEIVPYRDTQRFRRWFWGSWYEDDCDLLLPLYVLIDALFCISLFMFW